MHNLWADQNKIIINIGSIVTDYPRIEKELDDQPWPYRDHKLALMNTFRRLVQLGHTCRLALVNPGATNTDMIKHLDCKKIKASDVASAVTTVLANPLIKELTVYEK
jgi:NAD(P)-dependent dehydrogenase (short-subunit alcohol dehydrogenase family)